jgi:riboflavin kinase/FMN adenylyltransferase
MMQLLMRGMVKSIFIKGKVQKGHGLGKGLGFPTLNISYKGNVSGVFVGRVFVLGKFYRAAVHVGKRLTFNDEKTSCEGYLLNFDVDEKSDFVGETIKFELLEKIRDTKKFDNLDELKSQMCLDVEFVKNWYNMQT